MKQLTEEQRKKYSSAIKHGFLTVENPRWHSFSGTWCRKHPGRITTLVRLRDIIGRTPEWEDLTDDTLSDLKEDMLSEMSPNSVRTICAELKAILNRNSATKPIKSKTFSTILKSKKVPSQNVYLTSAELKRLHNYQPMNERERYAKFMFMRECLTGARCVDCRRFTIANLHTIDGTEYLTYVPQKHPVEVSVPVHRWLLQYLVDDWADNERNIRNDHLNEPIRDMCRKCGITDEVSVFSNGKTKVGKKYQFIATHTGRRTFATLLSLKGCPLEQIAIMMGHISGNVPNITMTSNYICARKKISKQVLALFS
jgi:integrase